VLSAYTRQQTVISACRSQSPKPDGVDEYTWALTRENERARARVHERARGNMKGDGGMYL